MGWGGEGGEKFRWYSDGGMFVEMDRGWVLTYGKRRSIRFIPVDHNTLREHDIWFNRK